MIPPGWRPPARRPPRPATRPTAPSKASSAPAPRPPHHRSDPPATPAPPRTCTDPTNSSPTPCPRSCPMSWPTSSPCPSPPPPPRPRPPPRPAHPPPPPPVAATTQPPHPPTRRALFEEPLTLEGFDFTANPKLPAAAIRDLAALRWLQAGESVILSGPVGVGKTHIAQALAHLAIRAGAEARFTKTSRALADLAGGHADGTWTRRLRELARPTVLILDDFAMRELTPAQADDLYELINERAGRSLILTSNRSPIDWYPLFPNPVVAESLLDRLINNSHQILMNGASYRPNTRPGSVVPQTTTTPR